jgi:YesN/AraC family two-component response regulator
LGLESGLERLVEPYLQSNALDAASAEGLFAAVQRAGDAARTINELFLAYRQAVKDLEQILERPAPAHRERNLRRAVAFIRERLSEPLRLVDVARVGGFAPNYFSRLFKEREGVTFEHYVTNLRIERAKQMLGRTTLKVERVGQLSGFASGPYFHRVFKQVVGQTPVAFRRELRAKLPSRKEVG